MSRSFWAQACSAALKRTVQELKDSNNSSNSVAVSGLLQHRFACSRRVQVSLYAVTMLLSAACYLLNYRLLLWRRGGKEVVGDRIWKHLPRFSGWLCAGSAAGVVAFAFNLQAKNSLFDARNLLDPSATSFIDAIVCNPSRADTNRRQYYEVMANLPRYGAVRDIFYPVQLLCTIFAMNMLLRRVSDHSSHR
jgi:hypothetical protein